MKQNDQVVSYDFIDVNNAFYIPRLVKYVFWKNYKIGYSYSC